MTSALFLSTDTLDKPLEGYAAYRKTPPSTDSLTQRSYLTHNKTVAIPLGTAAATVVRREAPNASQSRSIRREARSAKRAAGTDPIQNARSAPFFSSALIPEDRGRRDPTGFPLNAFRSTKPHQNARSAPSFFPASNPPKTGHRRARHQLTFRHTPQDARSPRRTKCAARASCMSEDVPKSKLMAGPNDYRAIDYPVFCNPAETPVTVERIRLMYSAFFSSAISSWFIRTSRRARTWAMDRAST